MEARAGRLPEAIAELRQAIKDDPNTAALWIQLSQWLAPHQGRAGAIAAAQKAIALEPEQRVRPYLTLADLYRRQRRPAEAEAELEQAIALAPAGAGRVPRPRPAALRAEELRQGARGAAAADRRAPEARPGALSARPHRHRDRAVGRGARRAQARVGARSGPRRRVVRPSASSTRAQNKPDEAVDGLQGRASRPTRTTRPSSSGSAICSSGSAASRRRRARSSRSSEAVPAGPARLAEARRHPLRAEAVGQGGRRRSARRSLLEPGNLRTRYFLATALMDAGKDDEARIELEKILRADPRSVDARVQLGFLFGRAKRYDEAVKRPAGGGQHRAEAPRALPLPRHRAPARQPVRPGRVRAAARGCRSTTRTRTSTSSSGWCCEKQQRFDDAVAPSAACIAHRSQARRVVQLHRLHVRREGARISPRRSS